MVMPEMGESVTEGTVLEWHKQEGDTVEADETLVEISTDKVDAEVPAPAAGTVGQDPRRRGRHASSVGAVLAEIATDERRRHPQPSARRPSSPRRSRAEPTAPERRAPAPDAKATTDDAAAPPRSRRATVSTS